MKNNLLKEKESLIQWLEKIIENNPPDHKSDIKDFIEKQIENIDNKLRQQS